MSSLMTSGATNGRMVSESGSAPTSSSAMPQPRSGPVDDPEHFAGIAQQCSFRQLDHDAQLGHGRVEHGERLVRNRSAKGRGLDVDEQRLSGRHPRVECAPQRGDATRPVELREASGPRGRREHDVGDEVGIGPAGQRFVRHDRSVTEIDDRLVRGVEIVGVERPHQLGFFDDFDRTHEYLEPAGRALGEAFGQSAPQLIDVRAPDSEYGFGAQPSVTSLRE